MGLQQAKSANSPPVVDEKRSSFILLVDDDADVLVTMQEVLEDDGYEVVAVRSGVDALLELKREPLPKLIILDLQMPRMSGQSFMAEVARHPEWAQIPVLVVSGDPNGLEKVRKMGASGYLRKPITLSELFSMVASFS